jgi:endonuclease/exonuclease/phosphatase family metal-dependent hydrolase
MSDGIYKIASFNMFKFSLQSNDEIRKNLEEIANIIHRSKFDIVGMQEVLNEKAVSNLIDVLNKGQNDRWTYVWICPKIRRRYGHDAASLKDKSAQRAEGFAYIWNTRRIEPVSTKLYDSENGKVSGTRIAEPHVYTQYRIDKSKGQMELHRDPYYIRLKPKGLFFEIRLINTHIRFGKQKDDDLGAAALRKNEFDVLTESILPRLNVKRYGNHMPSLTILMGDYNLNLKRVYTNSPYIFEEEKTIDGHTYITVQDQLTTLKNKEDENDDTELRGFANNFDHFSYDKNRMSYFQSGHAKRIKAVGNEGHYSNVWRN